MPHVSSPQLQPFGKSCVQVMRKYEKNIGKSSKRHWHERTSSIRDLILETMRRHCWRKNIYVIDWLAFQYFLVGDLETAIITGKEIPHGTVMKKSEARRNNYCRQRNSHVHTHTYDISTVWTCLYPHCVRMCLPYWEDVQSRSNTYPIKEFMHTGFICTLILFIIS